MSNFGDDLIMRILMKALEEALPGTRVVPIGVQNRAIYPTDSFLVIPEPGFKWLTREVLSAIAFVASARALVIGGGGVLQDAHTYMTVPRYSLLAIIAALAGKQIVAYGIGVGPVKSSLTRMLVNVILMLSSLATVRDEQSLDECRTFTHGSRYIHQGVDAVYLAIANDTSKPVSLPPARARDLIGLSFGPEPDATFPRDAVLRFLQRVRDKYRVDYVVVPGGFHDWDMEVSREIAVGLNPPANIRSQPLGIGEAISYWTQFKCVIGSKLHPLLCASLSCVPPLGMGGQRKVKDFVDSIYSGMESHLTRNIVLDRALETFAGFWATLPARRASLSRENSERSGRAKATLDMLTTQLQRRPNRAKNRIAAAIAAPFVFLLVILLGWKQVSRSRGLHKSVVFGE